MSSLIFDIETVGEDFDALDETTQGVLTRWIKKESRDEDAYRVALADIKDGLGFSPLTGEIVAIGVYDYEKKKGVVYYSARGTVIAEEEENGITYKCMSERDMLAAFWEGCRAYDTFVSFNGRTFDVPFLFVRSAIHGIRPSKDLMRGRYLYQQERTARHIDLLDQLTFYGASMRKGTLHLWTRAFGIESPKAQGVSGDDVGALFKEGRFLDIAKYNGRDLFATAELFERWKKYLEM